MQTTEKADSQMTKTKRKRYGGSSSEESLSAKTKPTVMSDDDMEEPLPVLPRSTRKMRKLISDSEDDLNDSETCKSRGLEEHHVGDLPNENNKMKVEALISDGDSEEPLSSLCKSDKNIDFYGKTEELSNDRRSLSKDHESDEDSEEPLSSLCKSDRNGFFNGKPEKEIANGHQFLGKDNESEDEEQPLSVVLKRLSADEKPKAKALPKNKTAPSSNGHLKKPSTGTETTKETLIKKKRAFSDVSGSDDNSEDPLSVIKEKMSSERKAIPSKDKSSSDLKYDEKSAKKTKNSRKVERSKKRIEKRRENVPTDSEDGLVEELMTAVNSASKRKLNSKKKASTCSTISSEELHEMENDKHDDRESDSDNGLHEDPLIPAKTSKNGAKSEENVPSDESSSDVPLAALRKSTNGRASSEDDSDNAPLISKCSAQKMESNKEDSSDVPLAEIVNKKKLDSNSRKGESKSRLKGKKEKPKDPKADDPAIARMKRYIRAVGLFVNYSKVFEGYKTNKKMIQKMSEILEEAGMKGKPTLEKCKKLKAKRENQKEVAELDVANIIPESGRGRRNAASKYKSKENAVNYSDDQRQVAKKTFSRLKGIIDSEESD